MTILLVASRRGRDCETHLPYIHCNGSSQAPTPNPDRRDSWPQRGSAMSRPIVLASCALCFLLHVDRTMAQPPEWPDRSAVDPLDEVKAMAKARFAADQATVEAL